jgi:hypothetical protein
LLCDVQVVRSQCLDYFTQLRNSLKDDHIIFRFESSLEFGIGERALLDQLCLQVIRKVKNWNLKI